ncbi:MAG: isoprenyl transferase [Chitinophagales bacterium]
MIANNSIEDSSYKALLDMERLPKHVAVIMDGNGRWAKQRGKNRIFGHQSGVKSVREATETCAKLGVPYLTLYAFSTENWGRPSFEVNALMELLVRSLRKEVKQLNEKDIRLRAIGDMTQLPKRCQQELLSGIELTKNNKRMTLTLALSYSSRWEITEMVKRVAKQVKSGDLSVDDINESIIRGALSTHDIPDPELLIRTSGELRISNYLLWQIAYTELYFTDIFWPDFDEEEFHKAIYDYQQRDRRFGKVK